jgi:hypothetical protein
VRLADERHLTTDVPARTAAAVLDALDAVRHWTPARDLGRLIPSYPERIDAEYNAGLLTDTERATLHRLVEALGPARWMSHGDPIPSNLLLDDAVCTLVD